MRICVAVILACCLPLSLTVAEEEDVTLVPSVRLQPKEIPRTFSPDSQFTIYGRDGRLRSSVYHIADQTRADLMRALAQKTRRGMVNPSKGQLPIVVTLYDRFAPMGDSIRGSITVMPDGSLSLQMKIAAGGGIDRNQLRQEIVRWLLIDLMLRRVRPESLDGTVNLELPDWLHQGCLELMRYHEEGRPSDVFASVFRLGKTLTVEEILNADITGLDSVSMTIYRVSSCALLLMLLEQPEGVDQLLSCIANLPANQGPMTTHLEKFFPVLRGAGNQLEKWWSLALATSAEPTQSELMTMIQTETELGKRLVLKFHDIPAAPVVQAPKKPSPLARIFGKGKAETDSKPAETATAPKPAAPQFQNIPITEFSRIMDRPDRKIIAREALVELSRLALRAHPFYRGLITQYQEQLARIGEGKSRGVGESLANLAKRRETMINDAKAVEDHLDWFEATQRTYQSGKFYDYLKAADDLDRPARPKADSISAYMDAMEKEFR